MYMGILLMHLSCMIECALHCHTSHRSQLHGMNTLQGARSKSTNQNQNISKFSGQVPFGCLTTFSSPCLEIAGMPHKISGCISFSAKICYESQLQDMYNCSLQRAKTMGSAWPSVQDNVGMRFNKCKNY
ncbi:hypothetical protein PanWU01x14_219920 [Parasponia andersonii]|uniref:Secreted protein n=1 Tax=Parasponia andersonii TaxID=3476 RepID=A0A2P5BQ91_PARAD|nr:hypothetical protein PanWU01x14_219920 [Parasponia andersonii]